MNTFDVYAQIGDVPDTFKRPGNPYDQWIDSKIAPLAAYTNAADSMAGQVVDFSTAKWGWLDVWGLLLGIGRNANEADTPYSTRIVTILNAEVGTVLGIQAWGLFFFGLSVKVTENISGLGYTITLPAGILQANIDAFALSLARIRPAGVPFNFNQQSTGLILDTINYFDATSVAGGYLSNGTIAVSLNIPSTTQNAQPLLPDLYLIDPRLNPS